MNQPATYDPSFHGEIEDNPWFKILPFRRLGRTNLQISQLSYGGVSLGNFYGDVHKKEAIETIQECIKSGINYIDTSPWYGVSEDLLGEALKTIPRNSYYIGTKVGRNFTPTWENRFDFTRNGVLKNVENSLSRLGLEYLDIIQIHDLEFCLDPQLIVRETLPALESVVKCGKAKYIGITSYDLELMKKVCSSESGHCIDTILSYTRFNFHDGLLLDHLQFFGEKDIGIINASPVAMGLLTESGPPDWHPAHKETKLKAIEAAKFTRNQRGTSLEAESLGYSLRPSDQRISTTLVSMPSKKILKQNLEIVSTPLTSMDEEFYGQMKQIFGGNCHWEGLEIEEYKKFLNQKNLK